MKFKDWLLNFIIVFIITFLVAAIITFLWNYVFHKTCVADWETAFTLALILGIVYPTTEAFKK